MFEQSLTNTIFTGFPRIEYNLSYSGRF